MTGPARKDSILAAALPLFDAAGYERAHVSEIAARVGVTEPVIFQNFGTKSGLFIAVLDRAADEIITHLVRIAEHSPDVLHLLSALLEHGHQVKLHRAGAPGMMLAEAAQSAEPSIRTAGRRAHRRVVQAMARLLRHGQAQGSIRDDVDATTLSWLVLSQIHAGQFRRQSAPTSTALEKAMLDALLDAMRPSRLTRRPHVTAGS